MGCRFMSVFLFKGNVLLELMLEDMKNKFELYSQFHLQICIYMNIYSYIWCAYMYIAIYCEATIPMELIYGNIDDSEISIIT